MNKVIKFFHELIHPHCEHCAREKMQELEQKEIDREFSSICQSCESLKSQLVVANNLNLKLVNNLSKPEEPEPVVENKNRQVIQTRHIPWQVKKQMLETESKQKAKALANAAKPDSVTEKLETQLGINDAGNSTETEAINS